MQLASTSTPRSATNSATCSYDNGYRRYQRTHKMITSPGCWRPLKGLFGVIGMDFQPTSLSAPKFATEPVDAYESVKCGFIIVARKTARLVEQLKAAAGGGGRTASRWQHSPPGGFTPVQVSQ